MPFLCFLSFLQVRSFVQAIRWIDHHWELTYTNTEERNNYTVSCDFVVIANGQYVRPLLPKFPGLDVFHGRYTYMCIFI